MPISSDITQSSHPISRRPASPLWVRKSLLLNLIPIHFLPRCSAAVRISPPLYAQRTGCFLPPRMRSADNGSCSQIALSSNSFGDWEVGKKQPGRSADQPWHCRAQRGSLSKPTLTTKTKTAAAKTVQDALCWRSLQGAKQLL